MNVFNRKMFQKGGEANDFLASVSGPEFETYQLSPSIEQSESGEFVYTLRNPRGEIVSEEFINTALSPTGDPVEAYKVQSKNKSISGAQRAVIGGVSAIPATKLAMGIGAKVSPYIAKGLIRAGQSKYSPFKFTKKPGEIIPGKKGFQALDPTKLSSYKFSTKPGAVPAGVALSSVGALSMAKTTEEEVLQEALDELSKTKKDEVEDKKAPDPLAGGISDEEIDAVLGADPNKISESMAEAEREAANAEAIQQSIIDFQDRYMDDKNLTRLLRNIGVNLVKSGSLTGIATGAAAAAEEKAAVEALEAEKEFELDLATAKAGQKGKPSAKVITDYKVDLASSAEDVEQSELTQQLLEQVENIIVTKNVTGLSPILQSVYKKALGFAGVQSPLDPRERAIVLLEQIANGNIKTITGESGRTISNVDRQIAQKLIGDLKNPLTREDEILGNLRSQKVSVEQRKNAALNKYKVIGEFFLEQGLTVPVKIRGYDTSSIFGQPGGSKVITIDMQGNRVT